MYPFRGFLAVLLFLFAIVGLLSIVAWANDVHEDRRHTVTANSLSPVFTRPGGEDCESTHPLTTGRAGSTFPVQRIRFWKSCATIDMTLPGGRTGHIVLGVGDYSVHPPLAY
jgi:tellurite resistance protein TehA-like permease